MFKVVKGIIGALLLVVTVAAGVYWVMDTIAYPEKKPVTAVLKNFSNNMDNPVVGRNTLLLKYNEYSCGDVELLYRGSAKELNGLDFKRIIINYPESQGWKVAFDDNVVSITRKVNGFCGMHKEYRHLGMDDGKLAVFQGPLGNDDILLSVVNIDFNLLPQAIKDSVNKTGYYNQLSAPEKQVLQHDLEYVNESELNAMLENLDEMK